MTLLLAQCRKSTDTFVNQYPSAVNNSSPVSKGQAKKPSNCPDLEVTEIRIDTMASDNPALVRFRFFVVVKNTGAVVYDPGATYGQH